MRKTLTFGMVLLASSLLNPGMAQNSSVSPLDDKLGIAQKLGEHVPLGLEFTDETGAKVRLSELFKERPVVLVPVFYGCQGACRMTRDGLLQVLNLQKKMQVGKDFDVVVFSIKPGETPAMAADAKKYWVANTKYETPENAWHFLVGEEASIQSLATSIGFKYTYDKAQDLVIHPTAIIFVTHSGTVSYYLEGVNYGALEFNTAIKTAEQDVVGPQSPTVKFPACYAVDPKTGKKRLVVENVLLWLGLLTAVVLAASVVHMSVKYRRTPLEPGDLNKGGEDAPPSDKA